MKKILLVAGAALALAGCGEKGDFEKAINTKIGQDKYCFSLDNNNTSFPIRLAKPRLDSTGTGTNSVILDGFVEQGLMVFEQGYDSNVLGITEEGKKPKSGAQQTVPVLVVVLLTRLRNGRNRVTAVRRLFAYRIHGSLMTFRAGLTKRRSPTLKG